MGPEPACAPPASAGDRTPASSGGARLPRGTAVGRYLVLDPIGEGGMGTVSAAYDPELDRKVALKIVAADASEEDGARLLREARALAKLVHPNVVAVHDVGEFERGVFLAMELVEGLTLRAWMAARPRWREVVKVFVAAGRGLAAAHAAGLVHRDFKPANVVLGRDGRVRVVDFGLARSAQSLAPVPAGATPLRGSTDLVVTQAAVVGTPAYMAPEQHDGGTVDARADQWAFCVALHEALLGVRPFVGNDEAQLRAAVHAGQRVAVAERDVPPVLLRAIDRGLQRDPASRHADMAAVLVELERSLRRRPRRVLAGVAASAVLAAAAIAAWSRRDPPVAGDSAPHEAAITRARAAAAKAYFVYPPAQAPGDDTAWRVVAALEQSAEPDALAAAATLREEFASTLVRLGDRYWDVDGGRAFAMDYYVQALVFAPLHERARARATVTPGELALLRHKADDGSFSPAELDAAEVLVILADDDDTRREAALVRQRDRPVARPLATQRAIEALAGPAPTRAGAAAPTGATPRGSPDAATPTVADAATPPASSAATPSPSPRAKQTEDVATLLTKARAALRAREVETAEQLYHRALSQRPKDPQILAALSELHFDRGAYGKAVDFAERAVAVAPKQASLRLQLGDALFKVLRYADARSQYQAAATLGHAAAAARIAQLDAKLGG